MCFEWFILCGSYYLEVDLHFFQYQQDNGVMIQEIHTIFSLHCNSLTENSKIAFCWIKSGFSEMATKIWKNLPLASTLLSKKSCFVKTGERFFQILWPSHKVLISTNVNLIWMIWIDLFLNLEKRQKSFSLHYTKVQFLRRPKKLAQSWFILNM